MKTSITEWCGCAFGAIMTVVQTQEIFQIISLILTILATAATLAFTIWKWWVAAKADNKITPEEIQEGLDIVKKGIEDTKDIIDKAKDINDK